MASRVKRIIRYLLLGGLTVALLWLSLRSIAVGEGENKADFLWQTWLKSDKICLMLMAAAAVISHLLRAERWRLLLIPSGNHVSLGNGFLSVMIGYLVNLAIPRGGEVSRCYNLYKLEKTPVEISFGTVVVERMVDLLCLVLLIIVSFFVEWKKLSSFIDTLPIASSGSGFHIPIWVYLGLLMVAGIAVALYLFRKNEGLQKIIIGFKEGLLSIFRLKNKGVFIFHSLAIWALYFVMSYFVIKAFPETAGLGFSAVMTLFAVGAIAMAVPLPGGAGSYHTLVPLALVSLYQMKKTDAVAFVFIFHAWQTLILIVGGVISLAISYWMMRWKIRQTK